MILVGHPFQMRIVEEVQADHLLNCENNHDYTVINTETKEFFNPISKVWEAMEDKTKDGQPTG